MDEAARPLTKLSAFGRKVRAMKDGRADSAVAPSKRPLGVQSPFVPTVFPLLAGLSGRGQQVRYLGSLGSPEASSLDSGRAPHGARPFYLRARRNRQGEARRGRAR